MPPHYPRLNAALARQRQLIEDPFSSDNENVRRHRRALRELIQAHRIRQYQAHASHPPQFGGMRGHRFPRLHRHYPNSGMGGFGRRPSHFVDPRNQHRIGLLNFLARSGLQHRPAYNTQGYSLPGPLPTWQHYHRGYPPSPHSRASPWHSYDFADNDDFTDDEDDCTWYDYTPTNNRFVRQGLANATLYPDYNDDDYEGYEDYGDDEFDDEDEDEYDYC